MKKSMVLCAGICAVLAFASCSGSKESAYKKAYLKAQAKQEQPAEQPVQEEAPVVAPLVEKPANVVVGSFGVKANAEGLQSRLNGQGLQGQIVYNSERNLYRVVATTFATKSEAAQSRDQLRSQFPDAWLLYKK